MCNTCEKTTKITKSKTGANIRISSNDYVGFIEAVEPYLDEKAKSRNEQRFKKSLAVYFDLGQTIHFDVAGKGNCWRSKSDRPFKYRFIANGKWRLESKITVSQYFRAGDPEAEDREDEFHWYDFSESEVHGEKTYYKYYSGQYWKLTWSDIALSLSKLFKDSIAYVEPCWKCDNASGFIKAYQHVKGGICFACAGTGGTNVRLVNEE